MLNPLSIWLTAPTIPTEVEVPFILACTVFRLVTNEPTAVLLAVANCCELANNCWVLALAAVWFFNTAALPFNNVDNCFKSSVLILDDNWDATCCNVAAWVAWLVAFNINSWAACGWVACNCSACFFSAAANWFNWAALLFIVEIVVDNVEIIPSTFLAAWASFSTKLLLLIAPWILVNAADNCLELSAICLLLEVNVFNWPALALIPSPNCFSAAWTALNNCELPAFNWAAPLFKVALLLSNCCAPAFAVETPSV